METKGHTQVVRRPGFEPGTPALIEPKVRFELTLTMLRFYPKLPLFQLSYLDKGGALPTELATRTSNKTLYRNKQKHIHLSI